MARKRPASELDHEEIPKETAQSTFSSDSDTDDELSTPQESQPKTFSNLGLNPWLLNSLKQLSIQQPTEVQDSCIGPILQGQDVIGCARTGSGKTAAFALPILQKLAEDPFGVFALVLTPTRELAFQIAEQFRVLGAGINLKQAVVVGGMDMMVQAIELSKRPHVIVATPGRLVDHIRSSSDTVNLKRLRFLVMDEADRLLHATFAEDLATILEHIPNKRQTLLFSATMTSDLKDLQFNLTAKPFIYYSHARYETVEKLDQRYLFVPKSVRDAYLARLLRNEYEEKSTILFTSKCRNCERLRIMLRELGIKCTAMHSLMSQSERIASLAKFKSGIVQILLATDVGSRGLDIPAVQVVINYELPADATDYVHRVGRTARAGRGGISISFVTEHDISVLLNIEQRMNKKLVELTIAEDDVLDSLNEVSLARRVAMMQLTDSKFGERQKINAEKQKLVKEGRDAGADGQSSKKIREL
ncbi:hypothetical protein SmJEL517_g05230 [Synchytrium microbalum]|uniref:RNA helicase n=1 Tax=Synchytrium microbalum TaxID=1806994 RepID=A0A507BWD5_9FUNG|nr:uncharacterized protein SmJEL517_g05230 [Synchytrium microbalum]TPX31431.1 hypothetical protein SmJEL517_g05230 [Synchytrium microbalum]